MIKDKLCLSELREGKERQGKARQGKGREGNSRERSYKGGSQRRREGKKESE
jgi:hypothetical protein